MKISLDNLSLNTVLIGGALIAVAYVVYKASGALDSVGEAWEELDLNPFDAGSALTTGVTNFINSAGANAYAEGFKKQSLDPKKYKPWNGGRGAIRPPNAVYITQGRTGSWFVPV